LQDSRLVSQGTRKERGFPSRGRRGERAISQDGGAIQEGRKKLQLFADGSHATNIHRDCANAFAVKRNKSVADAVAKIRTLGKISGDISVNRAIKSSEVSDDCRELVCQHNCSR